MPFSEEKADRAVNFFEKVLVHTKGRFAGKPFLLLPWQKQIIRDLFGTLNEDGTRQYRTAYVEVPKKNGKSELAAGIALYMLVADGEPGAEIYSAAAAKDQASLVFKVAASMVEKSAVLSKRLVIVRSTKVILKRGDPDTFYRAISADGDLQDGINPHCSVNDELHRWKVAKAVDLRDVLTKGTIARDQPLNFEITTAGIEDESPVCWKQHEYARQVADGTFVDPTFYGVIYGATPEDNWKDPAVWAKANPSLETNGGFLKISAIEKEFREASNDPTKEASFKRFHLNIWATEGEFPAIPMDAWNECGVARRPIIERTCYAGLDLSAKHDLTSLVLVFPSEDGTFDVLPHFWMPEKNVREREIKDRVPYSQWVKDGFIEATPGDTVDYEYLVKRLKWCMECFDLKQVGFDSWGMDKLQQDLTNLGFNLVPINQQFVGMSEPFKWVIEKTLQRKFRHEGHPVLRWNAKCLEAKSDGLDRIRPIKPNRLTSSRRIDGMVALIIAAARAMLDSGIRSKYESQEVFVVG